MCRHVAVVCVFDLSFRLMEKANELVNRVRLACCDCILQQCSTRFAYVCLSQRIIQSNLLHVST